MVFVFESLQEFNLTANFMLINIKMGGGNSLAKVKLFFNVDFYGNFAGQLYPDNNANLR